MESGSGGKKAGFIVRIIRYTHNNFTTKWKNLNGSGKFYRVSLILGFLFVVGSTVNQNPQVTPTQQNVPVQQAASVKEINEKPKLPGYGETITAGNFEVTLNGYKFSKQVDTGNEFANIAPQEGNRFLIMSVTYKNISDKSKMAFPGAVYIEYNGKTLKYDHAETIPLEGWGLLLDQLNPLTSKTTKLVFKIPSEIKGPVYWEPEGGKRFTCGNI